jgi:hypothetical protein
MGKLYFEDIVDVNTPYPYVFVYLLPDDRSFSPSEFAPFMELVVQEDRNLVMTIFESANPVALGVDQWLEISRVAKEYYDETLANDD